MVIVVIAIIWIPVRPVIIPGVEPVPVAVPSPPVIAVTPATPVTEVESSRCAPVSIPVIRVISPVPWIIVVWIISPIIIAVVIRLVPIPVVIIRISVIYRISEVIADRKTQTTSVYA
jgi:hypothetical protein